MGRTKQWGTETLGYLEGRGMGRGTWGIEDGHYRDFQEGKEVGLGGLSGVEKIEDLDGG